MGIVIKKNSDKDFWDVIEDEIVIGAVYWMGNLVSAQTNPYNLVLRSVDRGFFKSIYAVSKFLQSNQTTTSGDNGSLNK